MTRSVPCCSGISTSRASLLLYSVPWPAQGLYSVKPVDSMADMRKIKWRAYSPATARMGELMGAQAVTVQAAELSQAMATGVVEAFITSSTTGVDSRIHEQMKNFYDLQAWLPKNAVLVNAKAFHALDKPQQDAVLGRRRQRRRVAGSRARRRTKRPRRRWPKRA